MSSDLQKDTFAATGGCVAAVGVLLLVPVSTFYETWVAMTIWGWFAPWALPFTLVQGVGMNTAVSLITRSMTHAKDERTTVERWRALLLFYMITPTMALGFAWFIRWVWL
jgi:hypothetical protein